MLFAWLIKEKKFVLFGESDGVIQNEYLSKPRLLSMRGDVYMGGVKGLLHINSKIPLTTSELPQLHPYRRLPAYLTGGVWKDIRSGLRRLIRRIERTFFL